MKLNAKGLVTVVYFPGDGTYIEYDLPSVGAQEALRYGGSSYVLKSDLEAEIKKRQKAQEEAILAEEAAARAQAVASEQAARAAALAEAARKQEEQRLRDEASAAEAREALLNRTVIEPAASPAPAPAVEDDPLA